MITAVDREYPRALTHLGDDERMFQASVREFAADRIAPLVTQMDEAQKLDAGLMEQLFHMGLMGVEIPEEYGGAGGTFFEACLAIEAISAVDPSVGVLVDVQNTLCVNALRRWGNEAQKRRWLSRMASDTVGSYALSEAGSGSDAFALRTRATRRADGSYVLNGQKLWITNALESGLFLVFATLDPELGYKGITAFIVEKGATGLSLGRKEDKLGIRASSTCELVFSDCVVPEENVLGEPGKGYKIAIETLNEGRIGIGAQMLGLAQGAWDHAAKWAKQRRQFGKPLVEFQAMQFQLAEMAIEIELARLAVYNAARLKDAGRDFLKEAAICKVASSRTAEHVASLAIEIFGGSGFVRDHPVEKLFRDSKIGTIYEGTTFMQLATIARLTLGLRG
jgi:alkylation response protein AidB-like acyl-CoA dehydrogenase